MPSDDDALIIDWPEAPRLLRLSFVRPPPASVALNDAFEVVVAITDDLGETAFGWQSLELAFTAIDSSRALSVLANEQSSIRIEEQRGSQHRVKLSVHATDRSASITTSFRLRVKATPAAFSTALSPHMTPLLSFLGEGPDACAAGDESFVVLSLETCAMRFEAKAPSKAPKVQSFLRHFTLPSEVIDIVESPHASGGLGIGGSHLWDASLILAYLLPTLLATQSSSRPIKVVELGAGCGLVSIAARRCPRVAELVATDLPETVDGSLTENINLNGRQDSNVRAMPLEWGEPMPEDLMPSSDEDLLVLASDVLYNPSSHDALLATIEGLLRSNSGSGVKEALLAYRPRTEGDDGFFGLATEEGFSARIIARIGIVTIWRIA